MSVGELWVAHPLFPWLMIVLAMWVGSATIVMIRSWIYIRKLQRHNKLLQEMVVEGVGNLARRIKKSHPVTSEEECSDELCSGKAGIRIEEQPAPAIEEADEDWDESSDDTCDADQVKERAGSRKD